MAGIRKMMVQKFSVVSGKDFDRTIGQLPFRLPLPDEVPEGLVAPLDEPFGKSVGWTYYIQECSNNRETMLHPA